MSNKLTINMTERAPQLWNFPVANMCLAHHKQNNQLIQQKF